MSYANNKGADQPAHRQSDQHLCFRCLDNMISLVSKFWLKLYLASVAEQAGLSLPWSYTGHSRYVDFAYLDTTTYIEVVFHSQHFFCIFLCISTPYMSKTVNMKQRISRGDFSCPRCIFYYICYCLCRNKNRRSHGRQIVSFGYVHVLAEVWTSSKHQ